MPKLYNTQTRREETLPEGEIQNAILSGTHSYAAGERVNVRDESGERASIPAENLQKAFQAGFTFETPTQSAIEEHLQENAGLKGSVKVALGQFADEALMGLPELIFDKTQDPLAVAKKEALKKEHEFANTLGGIAGFGASTIVGAPIFKGAQKTGEIASKIVAEKLMAKGGEELGKRTAGRVAKDIVARMTTSAAKLGTESAVLSAPKAITEAALGDPEAAGETMLYGVGLGAIFGAGGSLAKDAAKLAAKSLKVQNMSMGDIIKESGKKSARILTGTDERAIERYLVRKDQVNAADDLKTITDRFLEKVDEASDLVSSGSGEGYKLLENSGLSFSSNAVTTPILKAMSEVEERAAYSPDIQASIKKIMGIAETAESRAADGVLPAIEVRRIVDALREEGYQLKRMGLGKQGQIGDKIRSASSEIDGLLKTFAPYKEHMAKQAENTVALKDIASKFRSEAGAQNLLKRIMNQKDERSAEVLRAFDEQFGTNYYDDLLDSWAKSAFQKDTTNGSRKTLLGTVVGSVLGGPFGGVIGGTVGAGADAYGTAAVKAGIDGLLLAEQAMKRTALKMDELPKILERMSDKVSIPKSAVGSSAVLRLMTGEPEAKNEKAEVRLEKFTEKAAIWAADPGKFSEKIAEIVSPISNNGAPNIGTALNQKYTQAFGYLWAELPKADRPQNPFQKKRTFKPTVQQMHAFEQKAQVVFDPFSVMTELERGTLTKNHIGALQTIYPKIYEMMRRKVHESVINGVKPLTYSQRIKLSLLLDEPLDPSLRPEAVKQLQGTYFKAVDETAPQAPNGKPINLAQGMASRSQQLAAK